MDPAADLKCHYQLMNRITFRDRRKFTNMEMTRLESLPQEILLNIFSFLDSFDLIALSQLHPYFDNICCSRELNKSVDLSQKYNLSPEHLKHFFIKKIRCEYITSLNINCVYWVHVDYLRRSLTNLHALEELYILDTKLGFAPPDIALYNKFKQLKKIALTMGGSKLSKNLLLLFPQVTHLCLHIYTKSEEILFSAFQLIQRLKQLEVLQLCEPCQYFYNGYLNIQNDYFAPTLKKLALQLYNVENINLPHQLKKFYYNTRDGFEYMGEKCENIDLSLTRTDDSSWLYLVPYINKFITLPISQSRKLFIEETKIEDMELVGINFAHRHMCPNIEVQIGKMLSTSKISNLKQLSINQCALIRTKVEISKSLDSNGKKTKTAKNGSLIEYLSLHSTLEELEIWTCCSSYHLLLDKHFSHIQYLQHLKSLTLDNIPKQVNGKFLSDVLRNCKELSLLQIKLEKINSTFNNYIYIGLPHGKSLKQVRLEYNNTVNMDRLLESLSKIKGLERCFITSPAVTIFSEKYFHRLLSDCVNLKFFCAIIENLPKTTIKKIHTNIKQEHKSPEKIIMVDRDYTNILKCPSVYMHENVKHRSRVCTMDIFKCKW